MIEIHLVEDGEDITADNNRLRTMNRKTLHVVSIV